MNAIDLVIEIATDEANKEEISAAENELLQLRAAAAEQDAADPYITKWLDACRERDDLQRHLDAINAEFAAATGFAYQPGANFDAHEAIAQLKERIVAQAAQLEQAYHLLTDLDWNDWDSRVDAWIDAYQQRNAPQEEREMYFGTTQAYRNALEEIERAFVAESVRDEHLASLKMYTTAARTLNNADDEARQEEREG